jgi:hypothetical protein
MADYRRGSGCIVRLLGELRIVNTAYFTSYVLLRIALKPLTSASLSRGEGAKKTDVHERILLPLLVELPLKCTLKALDLSSIEQCSKILEGMLVSTLKILEIAVETCLDPSLLESQDNFPSAILRVTDRLPPREVATRAFNPSNIMLKNSSQIRSLSNFL